MNIFSNKIKETVFLILFFCPAAIKAEPESKILTINIDKTGKKIAAGDSEGNITVFDRFTSEKYISFPLNETMNEISMLPESLIVSHGSKISHITWGQAKFVSISGQTTFFEGSILNIRTSNDGKFVSGIVKNIPYLVEITQSSLSASPVKIQEHAEVAVMHPDKPVLLIGTSKGSLFFYDAEKMKLIKMQNSSCGGITDLAFSRDGNLFAACRKQAACYEISKSWNLKKIYSTALETDKEAKIRIYPGKQGSYVLVSTSDSEILWEPEQRSTKINKLSGFAPSVCSDDVSLCVKQTGNKRILIFDVPDFSEIRTINLPY
jgi:hypothetical protein